VGRSVRRRSLIVLGLVNTLVANVFGEYDYCERAEAGYHLPGPGEQ